MKNAEGLAHSLAALRDASLGLIACLNMMLPQRLRRTWLLKEMVRLHFPNVQMRANGVRMLTVTHAMRGYRALQ